MLFEAVVSGRTNLANSFGLRKGLPSFQRVIFSLDRRFRGSCSNDGGRLDAVPACVVGASVRGSAQLQRPYYLLPSFQAGLAFAVVTSTASERTDLSAYQIQGGSRTGTGSEFLVDPSSRASGHANTSVIVLRSFSGNLDALRSRSFFPTSGRRTSGT